MRFTGARLLAMSLTSKTNPYKSGFAPFVNDIYRIPYAYCYRCSYNLTYPSCKMTCAHALEDAFKRLVPAESVAAVIVEPILGEGGFVTPPKEFFGIIQEICRKHGIVFIADEVQTGVGRTGKFFAIEHYGVEPDLIITAKSLGGGLPIGAITGRAEIMDAPGVGGLGSTFAGNPASCAAALASIEMIENGGLLQRATAIGKNFEPGRVSGRRNGRWSGKCGELAGCAPSNWYATAKHVSRPTAKRKKSRITATSMG